MSPSDPANFINFCSGQQITNGMQITAGSCNGIPMGKIPATKNMISAMIANPLSGATIPSGTTFNISVQTAHLDAGFFVNPTTNYYTAPQDLNNNGDIIGHCHVTIQDIGSIQSTTPPDPTTFAFFKGIDDAGNGKGLLQAVVTGGLPVGSYRVCTMIAARNHQPVNMPVAQRGAQDDCNKFQVVDSGKGDTGAGNNAKNGNGAQNQAEEGVTTDDGKLSPGGAKKAGAASSSAAAPAQASASAVAGSGKSSNGTATAGAKNGGGNKNGNANGNANANNRGGANQSS